MIGHLFSIQAAKSTGHTTVKTDPALKKLAKNKKGQPLFRGCPNYQLKQN